MKIIYSAILITFISFNGFANTEVSCFDPSTALIGPCQDGLNLYFDKGTCAGADVANVYCSEREMTNIKNIEDETILPFAAHDGSEKVFLGETGRVVLAKEAMASNCQNASLLIGQDKESVEYAAQTGMEIGIAWELIKFSCND